jgi:predicted benzoate:H+ symporter BenE
VAYALANGQLQLGGVRLSLTMPVFVAPEITLAAAVSLALP